MPVFVRVCDYLFDIELYAQLHHLSFDQFYDMCNGPSYFAQLDSGFVVSRENFLISHMQTVRIRKLTEELKTYCMFYFDEEDLELCCSERKKIRSGLLLFFL